MTHFFWNFVDLIPSNVAMYFGATTEKRERNESVNYT
jgi:hypothetical protein